MGWVKQQVKKNEKIMENKSTICLDRLAAAGIIPCSPQEQCHQIPCSPQEQCHQIQSALDKKIALPSNNSFHSLPPPTERSTSSQHRTSHIMCTRNGNNTERRNTMQDNKPLYLETFVRPKLSLSLSFREKEEDFLAIKSSKLPLRPKKRLKCIHKAIHDVSPGCWLSDISQERYEVRENKSTKKRPRGLKAIERVGGDLE
ncbi:uncharacterized protein LOC131065952 isoform X2 [Cryptomeria japonica]|nr:uncharacterized protein LOC131065952 isoform X2 [Cryptomeria japonica]